MPGSHETIITSQKQFVMLLKFPDPFKTIKSFTGFQNLPLMTTPKFKQLFTQIRHLLDNWR